jgi:hypothetical protein
MRHAAMARFRPPSDPAEAGVFGRGSKKVVARVGRIDGEVGHDPAWPGRHHHDALREIDRLEYRMRHEHGREAVASPKAQKVVVELVPSDLVEAAKGSSISRIFGRSQGPGDRDPHLHAARELAWIDLLEAGKTTSVSISAARLSASSRPTSASVSGSMTLPITFAQGIRVGSWKTKPSAGSGSPAAE